MNLLSKRDIPPPAGDVTVFRISPWGPLFTFLFFLIGLLVGIALFIYCYQSSIIWGMVLSGLYALIMWGICHVLFRALRATYSPNNWLAQIGSDGILLKYRSYLHDDSPEEDPIALHLSWHEIADVQLQREYHTTIDIDEKHQIQRWFLALHPDSLHVDISLIKSALEFENRRKPAHFRVDDLKHDLFMARKNKRPAAEIKHIKKEIAREKKSHPGRHGKLLFRDRPVVFVDPDQLRMEWTHISPGRKKLRRLLAYRTTVMGDREQHFDIVEPMTKTEFKSLLSTLIGRDEDMEAIKLVKLQMGLNTTEAKSFIEKIRS